MPALINCLEKQGDITKVKGILFRLEDGIYETASGPFVHNLDTFPSPYQTGVFRWSDHTGAAMLTSRGCIYNCNFCYTPRAFNRTIRAHSTHRVLVDMNVCVKNGIRLCKKRRPLYCSAEVDFHTDWMTTLDIAFVARKYKSASVGKSSRGKGCISLFDLSL